MRLSARHVLRRLCLAAAVALSPLFLQGQMLQTISNSQNAVYAALCSQITAGCAAAYSMNHVLVSGYSGNLFQLVRASDSTTLNVGTSGNVVNLNGATTVASFCAKTYCNVSEIYDQSGNGNNLTPLQTGTETPALCNSATACAPPFWIDGETGLPAVRTIYPSEMGLTANATGITGGTHAVSVYFYGRNEPWSVCCGSFGISHSITGADTPGTMFQQWLDYGNYNTTYMQCSSSTTLCSGIDEESANADGANYTPTANADFNGLITWDGAAATNTVTVYVNSSTKIYSASPPYSQSHSSDAFNLGTTLRLGAGGDGSHTDQYFRDGIIVNAGLASTDYTALASNLSTFYASYTGATCKGPADALNNNFEYEATDAKDDSINSTWLAYGLRQMRASYYGPIADLTDSEGTPVTNTYGPASSGCTIDAAAATFCAANPPCYVAKLYNQGTWSSQNVGNVHDTDLDLTATGAARPTVTFNSLNGLPTMHGSGSQSLCSPALGTNTVSYPLIMATVARRTSGTGYQSAFGIGSAGTNQLGWNDIANSAEAYILSSAFIGTAADNTWHSLIWEGFAASSGQGELYVDGAGVANGAGRPVIIGAGSTAQTPICVMSQANASGYINGDVAEVTISSDRNASTSNVSQEAALFALQEAAWGAL